MGLGIDEGAGSGDAGGWGFWDYELCNDDVWRIRDVPLRYHYGPASIDDTSPGDFTRAELLSLAAAAPNGASAFAAAMAATGQASWYAGIVADAAAAQVPAKHAPPNAFRKMFLNVAMSYAD